MDTNQTDDPFTSSANPSKEKINEGHKDDPHHPAFPKQVVEEPDIKEAPIEVPDAQPDKTENYDEPPTAG